jgi:hypothetical protein
MNLTRPKQPLLVSRCRPLILALIASVSWGELTFAQSDAPAAAPGETPAAKKPDTGTSTTAAPITPNPEPAPNAGEKPKSSFRIGESAGAEEGTSARKRSRPSSPSRPESASTLIVPPETTEPLPGTFEATPIDKEPAAFVAPGLYGRTPNVLVPGQGVLARPRYRYGFSVGVGYDDNTFQTPRISAAATALPRNRSSLTSINGHWDVQWAKPRSVFTAAVDGGAVYYWNRPRDVGDYNARVTLLYIYRIDPRTQFSANVYAAHLAQPDFSNVYASQTTTGGDYITTSAKFDLSHRWTPHFSTNTSFVANLLYYTSGTNTGGLANSFWDITFGNEFRFVASPRLTWVVEGRYGFQQYIDNSQLNSDTVYFLGGFDWAWSRRLTTTLRAGGAYRSFDNGSDSTDPYVEVAATYLTGRRSSVTLTGRYGYEQSNFAGDTNLSYRFGIFYQRALTYRLSGTTGFNYVRTEYAPNVGIGSTTDVYDFNVGLRYRFDRHLTLGANYSFTQGNSSSGFQDFDRNRYVFSGEYEF